MDAAREILRGAPQGGQKQKGDQKRKGKPAEGIAV